MKLPLLLNSNLIGGGERTAKGRDIGNGELAHSPFEDGVEFVCITVLSSST